MEKVFDESWFYAPLAAVGDRVPLASAESQHMRKSLRILPGRKVVASNGQGSVFLCQTVLTKAGELELDAIECLQPPSHPPRLHVILSLLKGKDLEEPVEGLCQLNILAIHLVSTDHSQEFKGQNHDRLIERLRGKSMVALKQAKKAWLTEVHEPLPFTEWRNQFKSMPLILTHPGKDRMPENFEGNYGLLIGPEGGFSSAEISGLERDNVFRLSLGETRIRATHAPLLACGKLLGLQLLG